MRGTVQARGKDMVLEIFSNRDVEAWSIFQDKQFLFKGIGEDSLSQMLDIILKSRTTAIYRLQIYEDINDLKQIKEKLSCDGSFNFVLNENDFQAALSNGADKNELRTMSMVHKTIEERIAKKIGKMMDMEDEPSDAESFTDSLKKPEVVTEWLGVIGLVKSLLTPGGQIPMQLANMGNATKISDDTEVTKEYSPHDQTRLITAINTLQENDPNILSHLEKLAKISATNKLMFNNLISMLDAMP